MALKNETEHRKRWGVGEGTVLLNNIWPVAVLLLFNLLPHSYPHNMTLSLFSVLCVCLNTSLLIGLFNAVQK